MKFVYYANIMFDAYLCLLQRMHKIIYADVIGTNLARAPNITERGRAHPKIPLAGITNCTYLVNMVVMNDSGVAFKLVYMV